MTVNERLVTAGLLQSFDAAIEADPQWCLPHAVKAGFLLSLTEPSQMAAAQKAARTLSNFISRLTPAFVLTSFTKDPSNWSRSAAVRSLPSINSATGPTAWRIFGCASSMDCYRRS